MRKANEIRPTRPERILKDIIERNELPFRYTGNGDFWIGRINPDFVNINGQKVCIEVFGDYWHNRPEVKRQDEKKALKLLSYGWRRIVLWEHELTEKTESEIKEVCLAPAK